MIFEKIQKQLKAKRFTIVSKDHNRPQGDFFVITEEQTQQFANYYYYGLDVATSKRGGVLSPKILVVAPGKGLSWQYHWRF